MTLPEQLQFIKISVSDQDMTAYVVGDLCTPMINLNYFKLN